MVATTLTKKGQVTIPKAIRDALGLEEHDKVLFVRREHEVILKVMKGTVLDLKGSVKPRRKPEDFESVRATVKEAIAKRVAKR
ncbi:MAG: hypothetical protein A2638_01850 [Nitrospirae bacterium RIFCSPHIGHO2_01_FULL_66_17]|nr:MAG: hypothetical protein A2638_01850 [Nitrospirae bacterium RIFCSPHIGHO2_01_FULL_66_17]